jgi:hypothetical protein
LARDPLTYEPLGEVLSKEYTRTLSEEYHILKNKYKTNIL